MKPNQKLLFLVVLVLLKTCTNLKLKTTDNNELVKAFVAGYGSVISKTFPCNDYYGDLQELKSKINLVALEVKNHKYSKETKNDADTKERRRFLDNLKLKLKGLANAIKCPDFKISWENVKFLDLAQQADEINRIYENILTLCDIFYKRENEKKIPITETLKPKYLEYLGKMFYYLMEVDKILNK
jgi:hypothetical protein